MAFHPYPQVIPQVFNLGGFGPSRDFTRASTWPWIDHPVSGLRPTTERPVQTRFRSGSPSLVNLATYRNSLAHSSKGTPSPRKGGSDRPEAHGFRISFTPLLGVLFTVPSRYWCTIGRLRILSLTRWSSQIHASFHGPGVTWDDRAEAEYVSCTGLLPTAARLSRTLPLRINLITLCWIWCSSSRVPQPPHGNATRL